jgi:epoxyqueuosine reductase
MSLDTQLREAALAAGADFFGVADLSPAREFIREQGGDLVASFPRAVSIGLRLFHPIVDQLPERLEKPAHARAYGDHCYAVTNQRLDQIASRLADLVQAAGHRVYPVAASQTVDGARLRGVISNKMAAHLAGLGWIGKSCLLVTPEVGPRVRWATVLTSAPLEPTGTPMDSRCGTCTDCVDACPPRAFTGRAFREDEPRESRFDVQKCQEYRAHTTEKYGVRECGLCLYACPHGKRASAALS